MDQPDLKAYGCQECAKGCDLDFAFSMAFQPIVDVEIVQCVTTQSGHPLILKLPNC